MKNLLIIYLIVSLWMFGGLACKNNPLAKFTKQYNCEVVGEPEPQTAEDYLKRAAKHLADNNYSADYNECAFGAVSEAIKLDSTNAAAFALRGNLFFAHRKIDIANQDGSGLRKTLELALADLDKAIQLAPERPEFYSIRSSIYEQSDYLHINTQREKTLENLTKAIELSSPSKSLMLLYVRRGDLYFQQGDYENAVKDFTEAIELEPTDEEVYSKRSQAYWKLGKKDLSVADDMKVFQLKDRKEAEENKNNPSNKPIDNSSNNPKIPKIISGGVLNSKAVSLPKPAYPEAAKAKRISGSIRVQVEVDENGNVTSAKVIFNLPFFSKEDIEETARAAKFKPAILNGKPVKVTGVIVYNFVP